MSSLNRKKKDPISQSDLAGSRCMKDFVSVPIDSNVAEAVATVRSAAKRGSILYIYVTDLENRLRGVVPIRNLLLADDKEKIIDITSSNVVSLSENTPLNEAYSVFSKSKFLSLPVLDAFERIVGVLHAHELVDEQGKNVEELFEERSRGELFELLGIKAEDESSTAIKIVGGRLPWLALNLVGGALSAFFIHLLGPRLHNAVQFLAFVPVLLVITESLGMQTASIIIANLHRNPSSQRSRALVLKEIYIAFLIGLFSSAGMGAVIYFWKHSLELSLTIATTVMVGSVCVSSLASSVPHLFRRLKVDPRVAAGPVVLAIADPFTLVLFLLTALWIST